MRWVTYQQDGGEARVGVVSEGLIHAAPPEHSLLDLVALGPDGLRAAGEAALAGGCVVDLAAVRLLAPIPRPPSVRDCLCFLDHMRNCQALMGSAELSDTWYRVPAFYFACPSTILGPYEDVSIAPGSAWQDFELEIAAVIGTAGANLSIEEAQKAIIGYTILNDWSARDLQNLDSQLGIGQAKGKDSGITLGPFLVTPDELDGYFSGDTLSLDVTALVNDEAIGSGSTAQMDWSFAEVISYASRGVELRPGDVFGSGTVPGCTLVEHFSIHDPSAFRGWLHAGDVVTLRAEGLGEMRQTVRASALPHPIAPRPKPGVVARRPTNGAPSKFPYTKGLHEVGDRVWAWLLPDGGYGLSNAGLVTGAGESLLVDTLFDLNLTREMLDGFRPITDDAPIRHALITHSNGDHTHGNQLLGSAVKVIAAAGTAEEIDHEKPEMMAALQTMDLGPNATSYFRDRFASFNFGGIEVRNADSTFTSELALDVGGRALQILNLGPAHTAADSVVHVPDAGVLFAGDLLFIGATPIVWSGPIENWIAACDKMIDLDAAVVVPGHGPVTDADGIRAVRGYFEHLLGEVDAARERGLSFHEAADGIDLGPYVTWLDSERVVANVYQRYRQLDPQTPELPTATLLVMQAEWFAKHHG